LKKEPCLQIALDVAQFFVHHVHYRQHHSRIVSLDYALHYEKKILLDILGKSQVNSWKNPSAAWFLIIASPREVDLV
jgi:hypothetical protein